MAKRVLRGLGWIIGSVVLGFIPPAILSLSYDLTPGGFPLGESGLYAIWLLSAIILSFPLRRLMSRAIKIERSSMWESPEQMRDRVVNSPQFVGRLDKKNGLLDTTARRVEPDMVNQPNYWSPNGEDYNVFRLRGEILDQSGSVLEYVPVEIRAKRRDWVGTIAEGDRIRVEGRFEEDGILHTDSAFNYSTNSWVGNKKF